MQFKRNEMQPTWSVLLYHWEYRAQEFPVMKMRQPQMRKCNNKGRQPDQQPQNTDRLVLVLASSSIYSQWLSHEPEILV